MNRYTAVPRPEQTDVLGKRIGAVIIDGIVCFLTFVLLAPIFFGGGGPLFTLFLLPLGIFVGYGLLLEGFWNGQTVGKKILGIRVVREDGGPIGVEESVVRNLGRFVDGLFYYLVGIYFISRSEMRQRWGDRLAGTLVVETGRARGGVRTQPQAPRTGAQGQPTRRQQPGMATGNRTRGGPRNQPGPRDTGHSRGINRGQSTRPQDDRHSRQ